MDKEEYEFQQETSGGDTAAALRCFTCGAVEKGSLVSEMRN